MIRNIHVQQLREMVGQAERDLAGWRFLLGQAEQGERAGTVMPDPLMAAGQAWPSPPSVFGNHPGRDPYPAAAPASASVWEAGLPPKQENALGTIASEHDAYAQTPKGQGEEKLWEKA